MENLQAVSKEVAELNVLTKEMGDQLSTRQKILASYVNLFEAAVKQEIDADAFEVIVEDLKEQSENITGLIIENTEFIICELEIANKFSVLFKQREVSEILQTVDSLRESLLDAYFIYEKFVKSIVKNMIQKNSIDISGYEELLGIEFFN